MSSRPPEIITTQAELEAACVRWREAGLFAFDTEFIRDDTYDAILCLIQVTVDGEATLVDPTCDLELAMFWELLLDPNVTTVVHAGKEDCELCLRRTGQPPRNVFDVQVAAGFAGHGYPLSLVRLVEQLLDRRLSKGQTLTDWSRRPLTPAQVRYAVDDVIYLPRLHRRLVDDVKQLGRSQWLADELQGFEDARFYQAPPEEQAHKLKGSKRLDGLGLLVLARLVEWRHRWAKSRNRPIRALMRDDILVEIARRRPEHESDLEVMRGFPQARNRKVVQELLAVITDAMQTPRGEWPQPYQHREDSPLDIAALDLLSAVTQAICYEERLSRNLLGGTQRLRELLDHVAGVTAARPLLLTGWREQFIGRRLVQILEGRSEIHLSGWPRTPRLEIVAGARENA